VGKGVYKYLKGRMRVYFWRPRVTLSLRSDPKAKKDGSVGRAGMIMANDIEDER